MREMWTQWTEGQQSAESGLGMSENPYEPGTREALAWDEGWESMSATPPAAGELDDVCDCENVVHHCRDLPNCEPKMRMRRPEGNTR